MCVLGARIKSNFLYLAPTTVWPACAVALLFVFIRSVSIAALVPGQPTRDRCVSPPMKPPIKAYWQEREHGETNVRDSKVSNNSVSVSRVQILGNAPPLPSASVRMHLFALVHV